MNIKINHNESMNRLKLTDLRFDIRFQFEGEKYYTQVSYELGVNVLQPGRLERYSVSLHVH